jgi:hypothetical protein
MAAMDSKLLNSDAQECNFIISNYNKSKRKIAQEQYSDNFTVPSNLSTWMSFIEL